MKNTIHEERNRVRYVMNSFVISVGSYVSELTEEANQVRESIGKVHVDIGNTACKVPLATVSKNVQFMVRNNRQIISTLTATISSSAFTHSLDNSRA